MAARAYVSSGEESRVIMACLFQIKNIFSEINAATSSVNTYCIHPKYSNTLLNSLLCLKNLSTYVGGQQHSFVEIDLEIFSTVIPFR